MRRRFIPYLFKKKEQKEVYTTAKKVYCYLNGKEVAVYDSITKCAESLSMTRAQVRKAVDNATVLENGFLLKII